MKIHREGYITIALVSSLVLVLVFVFHYFLQLRGMALYVLYGMLLLMLLMVLQFFRSPRVVVNPDDDTVLCPADGRVVVIEEVMENEYFRQPMKLISIFMSPLNGHVNRYPIGGKVNYHKYHAGKFLVAWHPKSSEMNERNSIVLESSSGSQLLVRQIAGAVARRIVCYSKPGMIVNQGEELGFIKFGSRVDVFLPLEAEVTVSIGEKVKGGRSIIARLTP
jgi:phosphatidylserine decarboxylase